MPIVEDPKLDEYYNMISEMSLASMIRMAPLMYAELATELQKVQLKGFFISRAGALGSEAVDVIREIFSGLNRQDRALEEEKRRREGFLNADLNTVYLDIGANGAAKLTVDNFYRIMTSDPHYQGVRFNAMKNAAEVHSSDLGKVSIRPWTDADEADSVRYIEEVYHLFSLQKHQAALTLLFHDREYNPVMDLVCHLPAWDGVPRVELFLHTWMGVMDTPYTREVSRLIFAGGINRLFTPGCKFDEVPVLIGTRQGEGKSSIVRFLAMRDQFYSEVTQFEGKEAVEQLEGSWICEISEMLALTKAKEMESVKAFCSRQIDKYRKPYSKNTENIPRRCVFIGTTNNSRFLKDKTGNRRFYPVNCEMSGYDLLSCEQEVRDYILLCWAEARDKYKAGNMPPFADRSLIPDYRTAQENAMEDDWREDAIRSYLKRFPFGGKVCVRQLAREALLMPGDLPRDPTRKESQEIGLIMQKIPCWKRMDTPNYISPSYPNSRGWIKCAESEAADPGPEDGNTDDELPFPV